MKKSVVLLCTLLMVSCITFPSLASALTPQIDLNDFYADSSVTVSPDGSSATMNEDSSLSTVLLSNDPFMGEPGIFIPSDSMSLTFDYNFIEGDGDEDEFLAYLFDYNTGSTLTDNSGNFLELWLDSSDSGTVNWNLLGASFLNTTVGMEFQLNAFDSDMDSSVTVSNVSVVPEPMSSALFIIGGIWFGAVNS